MKTAHRRKSVLTNDAGDFLHAAAKDDVPATAYTNQF
jgi:hypothetical protein